MRWIVAVLGLGVMGGVLRAEENEKALRYHGLLLKRPESLIMFERFVEAWLDTGTKEELSEFLIDRAKEGGAVEWQVLAAFHAHGGEDEEALHALDRAVEKVPGDASLRITRAKLQARLLNFEAALADLEAAGKKAEEGEEAALRGLYLIRSGRPEEAVAAWKKLITARPKDEELREDLIELEVAEGLYDEALGTMEDLLAITRDPYLESLRRLRQGDILLVAGKREEALQNFQKVLSASGDNSWLEREVLAQVERVFLREDDAVGLQVFYTKLREAFPKRVSLRKGLAKQLAANGEADEAVKLFQEVLRITPGDRQVRGEYLDLLEDVERYEDAARELRAFIGEAGDPDLWERLAALEDRLDRRAGVEEALEKVLALRRGTAFGVIRVARLFERYGDPERCEEILVDGRKRFPKEDEVTEALAAFLAQGDRGDEAVALWMEMAEGAERDVLLTVARSLSAHGFLEEAFVALEGSAKEFERDVLFLGPFCQSGVVAKRSERVWPAAIRLVSLADSPTALESALGVSITVARQLDPEPLIAQLEGAQGLGERCLLAELHESIGLDGRALEILAEAEKLDQGMLVAGRRVRLLERRGDLVEAAEAMRAVIAKPQGKRPIYLRRLVDLLASADEIEEALVAVEEWKRLAPGDRLAWKRRAELLRETGQIDEAVRELRRAVNKFGVDEEEMRSELAKALVEAGELRDAERLYRRLYEEAEGVDGKSKWIAEMVDLARREGRQDELVEEFERRKRANPRGVMPLLALAEIYRGLEDLRGQQEVLVEAVRRRPGDLQLVSQLASVAEGSGDLPSALEWRKAAVRLDRTAESARQLAEYYFRNGQIELGLAQLAESAVGAPDPRVAERTLQSLVRNKEWGIMINYLTGLEELVAQDWRLRYIRAVALKEEGRREEAESIFRALLAEEGELTGVMPLMQPNQFALMEETQSAIVEATWEYYDDEAFSYQEDLTPLALPGDLRELQWMALAHLVDLVEVDGMEPLLDHLQAVGWNEARYVLIASEELAAYFREQLEANPDDARLLADAVEWLSWDDEPESEKLLEKAAETLDGRWAKVGANAKFHLVLRRATAAEDEDEALLAALDELEGDSRTWLLQWLGQLAFEESSAMRNEHRAEVAKHMVVHFAQAPDVFWEMNWWWVSGYLQHQMREGKFPEAIALMNQVVRDLAKQARGASRLSGSSQEGLIVPEFPGDGMAVQMILINLLSQEAGDEKPKLSARQVELLRQLGEVPAVESALDFVQLSEHLDLIEDDALRMLLWWKAGKGEETEAELAKILKSGGARALVVGAGYAAVVEENLPKAYEMLVEARQRAMDREMRTRLDAHLAAVAERLAWDEEAKAKIDFEPARRAILRLRRSFRGRDAVQELAKAMGALGMEDEMERLLNPRSTRVRLGGASQFVMRTRVDPGGRIRKCIVQGQQEAAVMEAAREVRKIFTSQRSDDEAVIGIIQEAELEKEVLALLAPGETSGLTQKKIYVEACVAMDRKDLALPVLRELVENHPHDEEFREQLTLLLPFAERKAMVHRTMEENSLEAVVPLFASVAEEASSGRAEEMHAVLELLAELLETLEPSAEEGRDLSFALYYGSKAFVRWEGDGGEAELPTLYKPLQIPKGQLASKEEGDQKEVAELQESWKRRVAIASRLGKAMLRHPQLAQPIFRLMHGYRQGLGREYGDFIPEAKQALTVVADWKDQGPQRMSPWLAYSSSMDPPPKLGVDAAVYLAHLAITKEEVPDDLVEVVLQSDPRRQELLNLIVSTLRKNEKQALEAVEGWVANLPEETEERSEEVADLLLRYLMLLPVDGPVMEKVLEAAMEPDVALSLAGRHADRCQALARWAKRSRGSEGVSELLEQWVESAIGAKETWPAFLELWGDDVLPYELRQGEEALRKLARTLLDGGVVSLEALIFISREKLGSFLQADRSQFRRGVRWQLYGKTVEEVEAKLGAAGLWSDESYPSWALEVEDKTLYETILGIIHVGNLGGMDSRRKIGAALMGAEGEGMFLKRLVGAQLVRNDDSRPFVIGQVQENAAELRKLPPHLLSGLAALLRVWIPEMTIPNANADTEALLIALNQGRRDEGLEKARRWVGGEFNAEVELAEIVSVVSEVVQVDVLLAANVWQLYLHSIREAAPLPSEQFNHGFKTAPGRSGFQFLFESFDKNRVSQECWLSFVHKIDESEEGPFLSYADHDLLICHSFCGTTPELDDSVKGQFFWQKIHWERMPLLVGRETGQRERAIAATYFAAHQVRHGKLRANDRLLTWLNEAKLGESFPAYDRVYRLVTHVIRDEREQTEGHRAEAQKLMAALLSDEQVPALARVILAESVEHNHPWLLRTAENASALARLMTRYANGKRPLVSVTTLTLLKALSGMEIGPSREEWSALADAYEEGLFGVRAMRWYGDGDDRVAFARPLLLIAAKGGNKDVLGLAARVGGDRLSGDLSLLMTLAEAGEEKLVSDLSLRPGSRYDGIEELGQFTEKLERRWKILREQIPENRRYRIDCLIAGREDSAAWKESGGEPRTERLLKLAKAFEEQSPEIRIARRQCLAAIAVDDAASQLLSAAMVEEANDFDFQAANVERQDMLTWEDQRAVLSQAIRISAEQGEVKFLEQFTMDMVFLLEPERSTEREAEPKKRMIFISFLKGLARHPEKAVAALPYVKRMLVSRLDQDHPFDGVSRLALAQAMLVYSLAEKGEDFDAMVKALPADQQKSLKFIEQFGFLSAPGGKRDVVYADWSAEEFAPLRRIYLKKFLTGDSVCDQTLRKSLLNAVYMGTFSEGDLVAVVKKLPPDAPGWTELRGSLWLMLNLAEEGQGEMIRRLLPGPREALNSQLVSDYDADLKAGLAKLLPLLGPDTRFQVRCLVAQMRSSEDYLQKTGETRSQRMEKLARLFEEHAPVGKEARMACLAILSREREAADLLKDEILKIGTGLVHDLEKKDKFYRTMRELIYAATAQELRDGNYEPTRARLKFLKAAVDNKDETALREYQNYFRVVVREFLCAMVAAPREEGLAFASQLLEEELSSSSYLIAMGAYALTGKGDELTALMESWPEEKRVRLAALRKSGGIGLLSAFSRGVGSAQAEAYAVPRRALLRAFLCDPGTREREGFSVDAFSALVKARAVTREDVHEVVAGLPQEHPALRTIQLAAAILMAEDPEHLEQAEKLFEAAGQGASKRGATTQLHVINAYRARSLMYAGADFDRVWSRAQEVDLKQLPEEDRKWFGKALAKWRRVAEFMVTR